MKIDSMASDVQNRTTLSGRALHAFVAICLLATSALGCVIVPSPALEDEVSLPPLREEERLKPGEAIVIFESFENRRSLESCLTRFLDRQTPEIAMVKFEEFREALYPWFEPNTFPPSFKELRKIVYHNRANEKLNSLNVRYLVQVRGSRSTGEASGLPPWTILPAGVMWAREDYDMTAAIWDLKRIVQIDDASVGYYGYLGMVNYVLAFGIALPPLQTTTCDALAEKLHRFLIGRGSVTSTTLEESAE